MKTQVKYLLQDRGRVDKEGYTRWTSDWLYQFLCNTQFKCMSIIASWSVENIANASPEETEDPVV
jgi:hypothetical protein